jgi:hypothetical protein
LDDGNAGRLGGQELPPGQRRPAARRGPYPAAARIRRIVPSPIRYPGRSARPLGDIMLQSDGRPGLPQPFETHLTR